MNSKSALHAILAAILLPWYGIKVCPFLESLTVWQLSFPIIVTLALQQGLRLGLMGRWIQGA